MQRRRRASVGRPVAVAQDSYLLRGIVKCAACGSGLQGNRGGKTKRIRYYRATCARRGLVCTGPQRSFPADALEEQMDGIVARFTTPSNVRERVFALLKQADEGNSAEEQAKRLHERLRRLARLYADLEVEEVAYDAERRRLQAELDRLTVPTQQAVAAAETFDVLQNAWQHATREEKRGLALTLFETVSVDMVTMTISDVVVQPAFRPWLSDWRA